MRKLLLAVSFFLALANFADAQYLNCGTDIEYNKAKARNPFLAQARLDYDRMIEEKMLEMRQNRDGETEAVLVIPVVFHVIHNNGPENISDAQIWDQMEVLNRDYNKLNADTIQVVEGFDTIIANVRLEFQLAQLDFEGNCTNGIDRIQSIETYVGDNGSKLNQWPRERYLNVWTVASMENGTAGYSQYPSSVIDINSARADGVIIRHNYIGRIGTGNEAYSRALTHEVGHYLDLQHLWGSTNSPEVECGDDGVQDTPPTEGHLSCPLYDMACFPQNMNGNAIEDLITSYTFDDIETNDGTFDPTVVPQGIYTDDGLERLNFGSFHASGVSSATENNGHFEFSNWTTGAPDHATLLTELTGTLSTAKYYEFTLTPSPGSLMNLTNILFDVKRSETGPRTYAVRSSLNNYGTNLGVSAVGNTPYISHVPANNSATYYFINTDTTLVLEGSKVNLGSVFTNLQQPVTFRIYAWNAEDTDGSFEVDNVVVQGSFGLSANVQNYMEYSYCSVMFTEGQKARMRAALASSISSRNNLYSDTNRALTGTDGQPHPCSPIADFYPEHRFLCIGDETTFRDNSTRATPTSWLWTFEDGNPATSTEQYPQVSFNSYGRKTVTLTVGNDNGSDSKTIEQCVIVAPDGTEFAGGLLQEGFDSYDEFYNHWIPGNYDNNGSFFHQVSNVGYSNNTCAKLNAFDMDVTSIDEGGFDIDELVSPVMNLSNISSNAVCTFKWSYATQSTDLAGILDRLDVLISNDCGKTYSTNQLINPRISLSSTDLVTAGNVNQSFVPTSSAEWEETSFTIPNSYLTNGFRMKFIYYAGMYPNNLYLDDINITGSVNVDEVDADFYGAQLFPNPTVDGTTTLSYYNPGGVAMEITLTDMSGRVVEKWNPNNNAPGNRYVEIATSQLPKGMYLVSLKSERNAETLKLIVK
ncbi:MAG: T9SS type A sorting domain-containing protein [Flavobacteriales bacterium]|nr:T9SS type A sorting domain-containing protein [Flavobacteriales bacterium]